MNSRFPQIGCRLITVVTVNTGQTSRRSFARPHWAVRERIQRIIVRGFGHLPGVMRDYVSVSIDTGSAQMLFMRRYEELLLAGVAWAPGSSGSLWELLLWFREAKEAVPVSAAIDSCPEPTPLPWLARVTVQACRRSRFAKPQPWSHFSMTWR
jgi:hypothetical protein